MKIFRRALLPVVLAGAAHAAGAAAGDAAACRAIADGAARLACYDAAFAPGQDGAGDYVPLDFRELWVNFSGHKGQKVEIDGEVSNLAEPGFVSFGKQLPAASTILVKVDALPRDVRVRLLEDCNRGCPVTVRGVVSARGRNHVVADELVFGPELTPLQRRERGRR